MEGLLSEKLAISADQNTLVDQVAESKPIYKEIISKEHEIIMVLNRGKDVMATSSKADASNRPTTENSFVSTPLLREAPLFLTWGTVAGQRLGPKGT